MMNRGRFFSIEPLPIKKPTARMSMICPGTNKGGSIPL
jgi:hypothetical protein